MFTREELFKMKEFNMIFLFVGTLEKRHVFPILRAGGAPQAKARPPWYPLLFGPD